MKIKILNELRDQDLEIISEAVESIIPPTMDYLVDIIKDLDLPNPSAQDVFAKYLMAYGPVAEGTGRGFDSSFVNRTFSNGIKAGFEITGPSSTGVRRWLLQNLPDGMELGGGINQINPAGSFFWHIRKINKLFSTNPVYNHETGEDYPSAAMNWLKKHRGFLKGQRNSMDPRDLSWVKEPQPEKAMLTLAQQYKSYTKQLRKYFKKNPELKQWEDQAFKEIVYRWDNGQQIWFDQIRPKFKGIEKYLKAHKDNHNKLDHIFRTHPRIWNEDDPTHMDQETGMVLKDSAWEAASDHITTWQTMAQLGDCPDKMPVKGPPCVFNRGKDGYFWFNHGSNRMVNCDKDDFGGCAVADWPDSILLMLQSGDIQSDEGLRKHVMVEWNATKHNMVQILGFGNSFPPKQHWMHIKSLWEFLGKPDLHQKAWQHLRDKQKITPEQIEEFFDYIGFQRDKMEVEPANMSVLVDRLHEQAYNLEGRQDHNITVPNGTTRNVGNSQRLRFKGLFGKHPKEVGSLKVNIELKEHYKEAIPPAAVDWVNKGIKTKQRGLNSLMEDMIQKWGDSSEDFNDMAPIPKIKLHTVSTHIYIKSRIQFSWDSEHFLVVGSGGGSAASRTAMNPALVHAYIMGMREAFNVDKMKEIIDLTEINALRWVEQNGPKGILKHGDGRESEWKPGMPTPGDPGDSPEGLQEARRIVRQILAEKKSGGVRIRISEGEVHDIDTGREMSQRDIDERFLMSLEEVFPDFDLDDENVVRHIINTIETSDNADEVMNRLNLNNYTGQSGDHAVLSRKAGISRLMTSHWFSRVETLNEIKTTFAGGKGWLSYPQGKLPISDEPPTKDYPAGGDIAKQYGDYKSPSSRNVRLRISKDVPKKPEGEPDMDFVEEKKKKFACGILPYKGEGENIQFLIGRAPQGWWDLFKGKMDEGETEQEAAKREFEEESSFKFKGSLDDAIVLTHKKLKIWLVEMPELDAGRFDISKVSKITREYLNGRPEIEKIGWFGPTEAENKLNGKLMPFIGLAMEKLGGDEVISEAQEITKLRIFDFDETIAFTRAAVHIKTPDGKEKSLGNQKWFDAYVKKRAKENDITAFDPIPELEKLGFEFDFSDFAQVKDPKLNKLVVDELKRIVYKNRTEPTRGVYVMTARGPAAKQPIFNYLMSLEENGSPLFQESDFTEILTVSGGSKKAAIEELLAKHSFKGETTVTEIAFWDDSQRNVGDVLELRELYPDMKIDVNHVKHGKVVRLEEETLFKKELKENKMKIKIIENTMPINIRSKYPILKEDINNPTTWGELSQKILLVKAAEKWPRIGKAFGRMGWRALVGVAKAVIEPIEEAEEILDYIPDKWQAALEKGTDDAAKYMVQWAKTKSGIVGKTIVLDLMGLDDKMADKLPGFAQLDLEDEYEDILDPSLLKQYAKKVIRYASEADPDEPLPDLDADLEQTVQDAAGAHPDLDDNHVKQSDTL